MPSKLIFLASIVAIFASIGQGFTVSTISPTRCIVSKTSPKSLLSSNDLKSSSSSQLQISSFDFIDVTTTTTSASSAFTSIDVAAATIDPTTALSQILGSLLNTPLILFVPIFVGVSVAAVIAGFIVWYANPTDPDE
mmetsp:Transcript_31787/g.37063  ORF Transcript_31787/g.37063 Transcript_31787/m.37063 type:complete len:137 (-) Transcript_31787:209-619(-)